MLLLDDIEQLQPVEAAALQPDVEEHKAWPARLDRRERAVAVAGGARVVALVLQDPCYELADVGFVVNDEDIGGHRYCSLAPKRRSGAAGSPATCSASNRSRIHAPCAPGIMPAASPSSIRPPCSSNIRPTMARPRPVPFSRVVKYGSSRRFRFSFGSPIPLSTTSMTISPPS